MVKKREIWDKVNVAIATNDFKTAKEQIQILKNMGIRLSVAGGMVLGATYLGGYYGALNNPEYDSLIITTLMVIPAPIGSAMLALGINDLIDAKDLSDYARMKTR